MINGHPSDDQVQMYSSGHPLPEPVTQHIESCEACLATVSEYRLLSGSLKDLPSEHFGFDLEALVMQQLPIVPAKAATARRAPASLGWILLIVFGIAGPAALVYQYRQALSRLIAAAEPLMIPLIATTALTFMGLLAMDMLRQYRKKSALLENGSIPATS